ncbi:hypothetical protein KCP70_01060 [Salmonella enterica subsp. enterica]|nr:hypothetical protein KCP70_01060 [Salmonella enterica subsp. enterica]
MIEAIPPGTRYHINAFTYGLRPVKTSGFAATVKHQSSRSSRTASSTSASLSSRKATK